MDEKERSRALENALSQIEKQFGKGSVMRLGDAGATYEVDTIPTGSLGLDIAMEALREYLLKAPQQNPLAVFGSGKAPSV